MSEEIKSQVFATKLKGAKTENKALKEENEELKKEIQKNVNAPTKLVPVTEQTQILETKNNVIQEENEALKRSIVSHKSAYTRLKTAYNTDKIELFQLRKGNEPKLSLKNVEEAKKQLKEVEELDWGDSTKGTTLPEDIGEMKTRISVLEGENSYLKNCLENDLDALGVPRKDRMKYTIDTLKDEIKDLEKENKKLKENLELKKFELEAEKKITQNCDRSIKALSNGMNTQGETINIQTKTTRLLEFWLKIAVGVIVVLAGVLIANI
jgi:hypothetical protein